ncbi:hypothetical protein D3C75_1058050 [compost metagenome]
MVVQHILQHIFLRQSVQAQGIIQHLFNLPAVNLRRRIRAPVTHDALNPLNAVLALHGSGLQLFEEVTMLLIQLQEHIVQA